MEKKLTIERVRELDRKWQTETSKFLQLGTRYGNPPPLPLHEEYKDSLSLMAKKWHEPEDEFLIWVDLQDFIDRSAHGHVDDLPFPETKARKLGIPFIVFDDYYHERMLEICEALEDDEDELGLSAIPADDCWDDELDLQEDAARLGASE